MTWDLVRAILLGLALIAVYFVWVTLSQIGEADPVCEAAVVVEVLNGCGVGGLADEVGDFLRDNGFDVMLLGNADDFTYSETLVVDRSGDRSKAFSVADALGSVQVIQQVSEASFVDATVIIGSDLAGSFSRGSMPSGRE
jgi:hypothetical protein